MAEPRDRAPILVSACLTGRRCRHDGRDRARAPFVAGAHRALEAARAAGTTRAVLTARSPSCGVGEIWCDGRLIAGSGVTAALFTREGFEVGAQD